MKPVILFPNRTKKVNQSSKSKDKDKINTEQSETFPIIPTMYYGNYYSPKEDDIVIGIITQKSFEMYKVNILASKEASLNSIDFQGATKKNKT